MPYPGLLQRGSTGPAVKHLQQRLIELGYRFLGPGRRELIADGRFGPLTQEAVIEFQMQNLDSAGSPLVVDGKVGPLTWEALFEEPDTGFLLIEPEDTPSGRFMAASLDVAAAQVGVREVPPNSNSGPQVEQYLASVGLGPGHAWCAAFTYWCAREAARKNGQHTVPLIKTAWTPSIWNWARRRGSFLLPEDVLARRQKLQPGCLFLLHGNVGGHPRVKHVGFVAGAAGGMIETIEGNTNKRGSRDGGGVYRLSRKIHDVYRFVTYG